MRIVSKQSFDEAVRHLAQYRPFDHEGRNVEAAVRDVVLGAVGEAEGSFSSLDECRGSIRTLWRLEIELDELRTAVEGLKHEGMCQRQNGGFSLTDEGHAELQRRMREAREVEDRAFADWEAALRQLHPGLTDEDLGDLRADLDLWIERVIALHGVEGALLLYPENPRAQQFFSRIEGQGLGFLPQRSGRVAAIRERALQIFIGQPSEAQRTYLADLMNVSYFLTVFSLDPKAQQFVQEIVKGQRIYLDTNVLYATLGLSKAREVLSVRRLLDLTKELGYQPAVTPWTLNELRESLRRAKQNVTSRALPPQELAGLMAETTDEAGFVTAYWRHYKAKGTRPEDFFALYSALETLLEEDGIEVTDEGCLAIDQREELIEEHKTMLDRVLSRRDKPDVLKEHDVKHRLLVDRLRGTGHLRFSNARYWFLTQDTSLPRYARRTADGAAVQLPFCVSTSAWAQVVRSLVPRTQDLDKSLVDLLASPFIRYRGGINPQVVQEVVARIDMFEGATPKLATEVLLDTALVQDVAQTAEPSERRQKIDNAIVRKAEELHEQVRILGEREAQERLTRRKTEAEHGAALEKLAAESERNRVLNEELEREKAERRQDEERTRRDLQAAAAAESERAERDRTEREDLRRQLSDQGTALEGLRRTLGRVAAGILLLAALAAGVLPIVLGWVHGVFPISGVIFAAFVVAFVALLFAFGRDRGKALAVGASIWIGVYVAIVTVVEIAK
jgi:predicted nucleic acid-binding protein